MAADWARLVVHDVRAIVFDDLAGVHLRGASAPIEEMPRWCRSWRCSCQSSVSTDIVPTYAIRSALSQGFVGHRDLGVVRFVVLGVAPSGRPSRIAIRDGCGRSPLASSDGPVRWRVCLAWLPELEVEVSEAFGQWDRALAGSDVNSSARSPMRRGGDGAWRPRGAFARLEMTVREEVAP